MANAVVCTCRWGEISINGGNGLTYKRASSPVNWSVLFYFWHFVDSFIRVDSRFLLHVVSLWNGVGMLDRTRVHETDRV